LRFGKWKKREERSLKFEVGNLKWEVRKEEGGEKG
jgi:hypothetical protein